jgi:hypothetical protein
MAVLRDVALIILAVEGVVFTLLVLVVLGAINYGLIHFRWWHVIPGWFAVGRSYLNRGLELVERVCEAVAKPVFAAYTLEAKVSTQVEAVVEATGRLARGEPKR